MARDIEEFLRKAAERRNQQQRQGQQPPQPKPPQPPVQRSQPIRNRLRPAENIEPEIIEDIEVVDYSDRRSRQFKQSKSAKQQSSRPSSRSSNRLTSQTSHSSKLGEKVSQVSDRFDRNVHQHLDHEISKVDSRLKASGRDSSGSEGKKPKSSPMAEGLRRMLAKPETMGQAILAAEILKRPNFDD